MTGALPHDIQDDQEGWQVQLTIKELNALAWCAAQDHLGAVRFRQWRDEHDVGWLVASISPKVRGNFYGRRPQQTFKVSPLGHVYAADGTLLHEGPKL